MDINAQQNECIKFLARLTIRDIAAVQFGSSDPVIPLTASIDAVLEASGSSLRSADLWSFYVFNTTFTDASGSVVQNVRTNGLRFDQDALDAVALLSGSFTVVE